MVTPRTKLNLGYSEKNIPIPTISQYRLKLIESLEQLFRRMRWKAYFTLKPECKGQSKETFGFNSTAVPPACKELSEFEEEMLEIAANIKFNRYSNQFLDKLKQDIRKIRDMDDLVIPADKTTNHYVMKAADYNTILEKAVQKDYLKAKNDAISNIVSEEKELTSKLGINDRVEKLVGKEAYATLKDHKEDFLNNPKVRLINPCKTNVGKIAKFSLERIVKEIQGKGEVSLWRRTGEVIDWFRNLPNNNRLHFLEFDVVDFYPSIGEDLLKKAINWAKTLVTISKEEEEAILLARKSVLLFKGEQWVKKGGNFDVTMGSYDGAEVCELVGLYMLYKMYIIRKLKCSGKLYRDDGLLVSSATNKGNERLKQEIIQIYQEEGLRILIHPNKKIVNFLDVTLNLMDRTFSPYLKEGNIPQYVNVMSNHPPSVIKAVPTGINQRLSSISSSKDIFDRCKQPYQDALERSGYKYKLEYIPEQYIISNDNQKKSRSRSRQIIYWIPPFSANVETNIGEKFLRLIQKCFPKGSVLAKAFNKNNLKLSYRTMPNIKQKITSHNNLILSKVGAADTGAPINQNKKNCNCRKLEDCPLEGNCLTESLIYQAKINQESYIGMTGGTFKQRFNAHQSSFRIKDKENETKLSKAVWELKDKGAEPKVIWKHVISAPSYTPLIGRCILCLREKEQILYYKEGATLNSRNEVISNCRHRRKFKLL